MLEIRQRTLPGMEIAIVRCECLSDRPSKAAVTPGFANGRGRRLAVPAHHGRTFPRPNAGGVAPPSAQDEVLGKVVLERSSRAATAGFFARADRHRLTTALVQPVLPERLI